MYPLRPATETDAAIIKKMVIDAGINPTRLKWQNFIVAENEGAVIGCGQLKPHRDGSVELASLVTAKNYRGQGIARIIIEHLIEQHPDELYLMCRSGLEGFYEKFGFVPMNDLTEMPTYYRRMKRLGTVMAKIVMRDGQTISIMVRRGK